VDIDGLISRLLALGADLSTRVAIKKALKGIVEDDEVLDQIYVSIKNRAYRDIFSRVPAKKRALFLPACLRNSRKCKAEMSPDKGYICKRCGACVIKELLEVAERLGYGYVYIVPGGSLVMRIIKDGFKKRTILAAVGVACTPELVEASEKLSIMGIPHQGIPLLKTGCVDTLVDKDEVIRVLQLGIEESKD